MLTPRHCQVGHVNHADLIAVVDSTANGFDESLLKVPMPVVSICCAIALNFCDRKGRFGRMLRICRHINRVVLWTHNPEYVVQMQKSVDAFRKSVRCSV